MPFKRANHNPIPQSSTHPASTVARKLPDIWIIALILASTHSITPLSAQEPPPNLIRLIAQRETETEKERNEYTYRQSVAIEELDDHGAIRGSYRETRDIIFSPEHERTEKMIGSPVKALKYLVLTDEDFEDVRNIQPLVLTLDQLFNYEAKFRGEETVDNVECWAVQVRPRQILSGMRYFDGMVWVDKKEYNIVRMEGQAVPQIRTTKKENLFPRFTTVRKPIDGSHWFPVYTYSDDVLQFKNGPLRQRLRISYTEYKRFGAESKLIVK